MSYQSQSNLGGVDPARPLVVEQPVVAERVVEQPVVAERVVEQPVVAERIVEPAAVERVATVSGRYYAPDSVIVGIVGVALLIVGLIAVARAGLDGPMDDPIVDVLGFGHTATLGMIEAAIGLLLLISAAARSRGAAIFFGLVLVVGGIVGAVQTDSFRDNLGLESGWAWLAVIAGGIVVLVSLLLPRTATRSTRVRAF